MLFGVVAILAQADDNIENRNCPRVEATLLRTLSQPQRAMLLTQPTIVTGLIEDWPAHASLSTIEGLVEKYGERGILAKRNFIGLQAAAAAGVPPETSLMRLKDLQANIGKIHAVLYPGEPGNAIEEEELVDVLASQTSVPDILMRTQALVVSLGGGTDGVRMARHGFAWIGLIAGKKRWYMDHPDIPKPQDPNCASRAFDTDSKSSVVCTQIPGEVIMVPTTWWHATCNAELYTLGIGGQDSCDMQDCTPPGPPDETPLQLHMRKQFCRVNSLQESCFGPATSSIPPGKPVNATFL